MRAYIGGADFFASARDGQVDMATAVRSPGSTLKPVIYGLAFDHGLAHPETLIRDSTVRFGAYAPGNFGKTHHGVVTLREALQKSLNVPAVAVMRRLGPAMVTERLSRAGLPMAFPDDLDRPGLAVALGGLGVTLEDLSALYAALADDGVYRPLVLTPDAEAAADFASPGEPLISPAARWYLAHILSGAAPPKDWSGETARVEPRRVAFKTGTSYGYRDAWAMGWDGRFVVGVWVGRPDGTPSPGHTGLSTAAPILFQAFDALPEAPPAVAAMPPRGAILAATSDLPPSLRWFGGDAAAETIAAPDPAPMIAFPVDGTRLRLADLSAGLPLEAHGGKRPLHWYVNGAPLDTADWRRRARWTPDGPGYVDLAVVDALGRDSRISVYLAP